MKSRPERCPEQSSTGSGNPGRDPGDHPPATAGERRRPVQPDEVGNPGLGHPGRRLPGDRHPPGAPGNLPRRQYPGGPGPVIPAQRLPEPAHRVGGDGPRRHRDAGPHDQAHLLRGQPEAVPGPVRQDIRLRALQRWVRDHAGRPDRQAPDLPDRRRLVRLQPGRQPGPDVAGHPQRYQVADEARTHELEPELKRRQVPRLSPWSAGTQDHRQTPSERRFRPFPISDDMGARTPENKPYCPPSGAGRQDP